jgi:arabinogalactan oligomer / maltooligosaccharide transport system permease protein
MKAVNIQKPGASKSSRSSSTTLGGNLLRIFGLLVFDAFSLFFVYLLLSDGYWQFATVIGAVMLLINYVFLREGAYPLRWMSPGLSFMILISAYPIIFTIYIAFTNFGTGNLLPKTQAVEVLEQRQFLPEAGVSYNFTIFKHTESGEFVLWLTADDGDGFWALRADSQFSEPGTFTINDEGIPENVAGYESLTRRELIPAISELDGINFGIAPNIVRLTGINTAAELEQRYVYDADQDAILDRQNDILYVADEEVGEFVSADGASLIPGYQVTVGLTNFERFITNPSFRGPLLLILGWTTAFALLSVFLSFSLGLLIAIAFGRDMPFQKIIKSALIIPFAVPQVITILIWKGLWNPLNGAVSNGLANIFNQSVGWPPTFSDALWVKIALIVVNVWLAYPYFMLVNSGALQAIPQDMFEAADIDGANGWQKFRSLTLPLLLVGVGPLLLGSFTVNFNSFNVIFLFNGGGPPMVGTSTPAGHSDILISYVYRLAFGSGGGQDFGYASAITIIIFLMMVVITLIQFRYMRVWEEVGENV